ncbi:uncharacterized protein PG998_014875 [Apiospora kogelbergensis]|uniref:uncharacterized protein n=1 Tax=Apiospora kogelbergensis TaxID=1337665 RepID=UPI00312E2A0B
MNLLQNAPLSEESEGVALGKVECPVSAAGHGHARTFSDTMREFIKDYPNEPEGRIDKECSIRQQISWEGVLHVLQSTGEKYLTKQGFKGKVRKAARFVGDKADVMKRVAGVIPEIDYSKPIIGALTFLLEAFKQTSKVRVEVKNGLQNLMDKFGDIEDYLGLYSARPKIGEAVGKLYVSMLKGIEDVIGFYTRNIVIKGLDAIWSGERYEQSLLDCLEKVNENGKKLVDAAHYTQMEETHQTFGDTKTIQNAQLQWLPSQFQAVPFHLSSAEPIVSREDLLDFLGTAHLETTDIEYIMDYREAFLSRGQDRAGVIMPTPQFRDWLVKASSKELLIHGNSKPLPISPLTLFCAMLVQNLRGVDKFWTVAFFCGRHPYEEYGGARTLITSLIAQLLRRRPFDLSFLKHDHVYQMDLGNVMTYCFVFGQLVQQIDPNDTVFCIIDGINFYEGREELLEDTAFAIRFLLDMTLGQNVFKILLSSPSTTEDVRQAIRDTDYLNIPREVPKAHDAGDLRFGRQLNESLTV